MDNPINPYDEYIIVLDFGGQYSQLIARRIREIGIYSKLVSYQMKPDENFKKGLKGIILSGGPHSVSCASSPRCNEDWFNLDVPVLGICYGQQLLAQYAGGLIVQNKFSEYGSAQLQLIANDGWLSDMPKNQLVWMSHTDIVQTVPDGFQIDAQTDTNPIAAMSCKKRQFYTLQFHPEVKQTQYGSDMLKRFAIDICNCSGKWKSKYFIEQTITEIREKVGSKSVLCAFSGGVDSTVTAALLKRALGNQLTCVLVDNGLMRNKEVEDIVSTFKQNLNLEIKVEYVGQKFLNNLKGVTDPETKRKIIGETFVNVFEKIIHKNGCNHDFLAQGTIYTDVVESGTFVAETIKSHHNVGGLPTEMPMTLLEPLRLLFKDEVRAIGRTLGIPESLTNRQPFPGPGLAIRIIGEVTEKKLSILRKADFILHTELLKHDLVSNIFQYFAALLNVRTVGVKGDGRTYGYTIALRAVTSSEGMTADWAKLPYDVLAIISKRICNEIEDINRVVYDITSKPPSTIEWE